VKRLAVALVVAAVMAATMVGGVVVSAGAQVPGQTVTCAPWSKAWYVSQSQWWYFWWWRWCYNPSLEHPWYVDWAGWDWGDYAGSGYSPGYYSGGPS
jgi:hypothetical protein